MVVNISKGLHMEKQGEKVLNRVGALTIVNSGILEIN
jgi:hypothetical protein